MSSWCCPQPCAAACASSSFPAAAGRRWGAGWCHCLTASGCSLGGLFWPFSGWTPGGAKANLTAQICFLEMAPRALVCKADVCEVSCVSMPLLSTAAITRVFLYWLACSLLRYFFFFFAFFINPRLSYISPVKDHDVRQRRHICKLLVFLTVSISGKWEQRERSRLKSVDLGSMSVFWTFFDQWYSSDLEYYALAQSLTHHCGFLTKPRKTLKTSPERVAVF